MNFHGLFVSISFSFFPLLSFVIESVFFCVVNLITGHLIVSTCARGPKVRNPTVRGSEEKKNLRLYISGRLISLPRHLVKGVCRNAKPLHETREPRSEPFNTQFITLSLVIINVIDIWYNWTSVLASNVLPRPTNLCRSFCYFSFVCARVLCVRVWRAVDSMCKIESPPFFLPLLTLYILYVGDIFIKFSCLSLNFDY